MNQLPILIKREFWQHRGMFLILPAAITAFMTAIMLVALLASATTLLSITMESEDEVRDHVMAGNIYQFALAALEARSPAERTRLIDGGLQFLAGPLFIALWFVIFFYLLGALFDDRRDRSILFWKSLPVSDALTVVSKLVTAVIAVPLVFLTGVACLQLVALLLLTVASIGSEVSAWEVVWTSSNLPANWLRYLALLVFSVLWSLPFFGWLLLVSAWARSLPLIWTIAVPLGLTIVEGLFTRQTRLADWIALHTVPFRFLDHQSPMADNMVSSLFSLQMLSALTVGGVMIVLAIWLRSKADEI